MTIQAVAQQAEATGAVEEPLDGVQDQAGQEPAQVEETGGESQTDLGFPAETALAEMTEAERAAYWKHEKSKQQRKFEDADRRVKALEAEAAELKRAALPEAERVAAEAREQARVEAMAEARKELLPALVIAKLEARGLSAEDAAERVELLDLSKLVDEDGALVADRLDRIAPAAGAQRHQGQPSPQQSFQQAGGAPVTPRTSLSPAAIADRAAQIKNKTN